MDENIVWRTNKYGHRFPIKQTNDYMNEKIRDSVIIISNENINKTDDEKQVENRFKNKEIDLYHGTYMYFKKFEDKYIGSSSPGGLSYGKGHYFFDNEKDVYSDISYHVKVKIKKPFVADTKNWSPYLQKMGYIWNKDNDPSEFLRKKGYDSTIIVAGKKVEEIIIYSNEDNKIKIIESKKNDNY